MNEPARDPLFESVMGWALPAVAALTPLIVVLPMRPPEQQTFFLVLATCLLTAALGVAWMLGWRALPNRVTLAGWLALGLVGSAAISIIASHHFLYAFKKALLPLAGLLLLWHLTTHPRRSSVLWRTTLVLAAVAPLLALYGIAQYFGLDWLPWGEQVQKNTVIATIGHPNFLASFLGPMLFVMLGLTFQARRRGARTAWVGLILLVALCIALARTRGVWLGVAVALAVLVAMLLRYTVRHRLGMRLVGWVAGGAALIVLAVGGALLLLLPRTDLAQRLVSNYEIKSRFYYWNAAIDLGRDHPVFGGGFGMFDPNFWPYVLEHQQSAEGAYYYDFLPAIAGKSAEHVHNEYLEVFAEQGSLGIVALLGFLLYFLDYGYLATMRCAEPRRALFALCVLAGMVVSLVDAMFAFPWRLPASTVVCVLLLAWLIETIEPQEQREPQTPRFS